VLGVLGAFGFAFAFAFGFFAFAGGSAPEAAANAACFAANLSAKVGISFISYTQEIFITTRKTTLIIKENNSPALV
jgi:hypothetical protein